MAISKKLLEKVIIDQKKEFVIPKDYCKRGVEPYLDELMVNKEIIILSGIRRCGKSTLLHKIRGKNKTNNYFCNFEDERLINFTVHDFQALYELFLQTSNSSLQNNFYFDEIQCVPEWERFIRRLYNIGNKIYITGSNASLFSEDLGTKLTGRYINVNIFPFSFKEFIYNKDVDTRELTTKMLAHIDQLFKNFVEFGGIPEFSKYRQIDYFRSLYESIVFKDIVSRYKITHPHNLQRVIHYLATNCSKEFTYNSTKNALGIKETHTVIDYCSYLENAHLCFFLTRYDSSIKMQIRSPRKIYFVDHAFAKSIGFHFSEDRGRILENIVFMELKRRRYTIYYHREKKECDFLVQNNGRIVQAIQVTLDPFSDLTGKTLSREIAGLEEAMNLHSLSSGLILTEYVDWNNTSAIDKLHKIEVKSIATWLLGC